MADNRWSAFWSARAPRERLTLAVGGAIVGLAIVYALVYEPLAKTRAGLEKRLPKARAELRLAEAQVAEIERLRKQMPAQGQTTLVGRLNASAAARGLRPSLRDISALGEDRARVVGVVPLAAWLSWIGELEGQGARVVTCRILPEGRTGEVSVEAILAGAAR